MKSILNKTTTKEIGFPKLMKHTDYELIVLFFNEEHGTVVSTTSTIHWEIGDISHIWVISDFQDYNGSVTLSNE